MFLISTCIKLILGAVHKSRDAKNGENLYWFYVKNDFRNFYQIFTF